MRVDAANGAEMVLRGHRVEAVRGELVFTFGDAESVGRRRHRNRSAHPANRATAAPCGSETFRQGGGELDGSAVAGAIQGDRFARSRIDQAATFSSASLTASSAS